MEDNGRARGRGRDTGQGYDENDRKPRLSPNGNGRDEGGYKRSRHGDRDDQDRKPRMSPQDEAGPSGRTAGSTKSFEDDQSEMRESKRQRIGEAPARGGLVKEERPGRKRREMYDIVVTKPENIKSKKGETGDIEILQTNYFRLVKRPEWALFQYRVDFSPECEIVGVRKRLIHEQKQMFGGYIYDSNNTIYLTQKLRNDPCEMVGKSKEGQEYEIMLRFVGVIKMDTKESLQILNLILRRSLEGLKLQLVGRNFFDAAAKIDIRQFNLQLWPGYQTSIRQHERDILLCAEITNKVMRTETIYDIMHNLSKECRGSFKEAIQAQIIGMTVLTDYTNKTYRIDEIDFDKTPASTFDTKNGKISFIDYYKNKYNIRIRDPNQAMLISRAKARDLRAGKPEIIALVPELCRATGLSEQMRGNFNVMKSMAQWTRMDPKSRIAKLMEFNRRLSCTPASMDVLKEWNFKLDAELVEVQGRILKSENIVFGNGRKESSGQRFDWTPHFRNNAMFASVSLQRWYLIFPNRCGREANNFVQTVQNAARGMRFEINRPQIITLHDDRNHSYINAIESCANRDPQLLMLVVPNNNADRYSNIKKQCCVERAIPTQVLCQKTITPKGGNPNSLMSVATKVAIQLNCKLGGSPWMIELPLSGLMTIGFDIARDSKDKKKTYGALVATMDLKTSVKFYSCVSTHSNGEELSNDLPMGVAKALKEYRDEHGTLPARICFYRDGVGEGQTQYVFEHEVKTLLAKLDHIYKTAKAPNGFRLCFMIVSKRINTRLFANKQNPQPGTVVDDIVTLPERFDFYLVSQSVRQGTVSPTSYNILYDNMGLSPDKLQQLTYKQTHLYYNWSGTTRVPAVCQYASKLASLVGQYIHQCPAELLKRQLYFL